MPGFYHGGIPGLKPGDYLLPPCDTGMKSSAEYGAQGVCRKDRVYLAIDPKAAALWAAMWPLEGQGEVYEAEPEDPKEPDPDCTVPGFSIACRRAKVVRSLMTVPPLTDREIDYLLRKGRGRRR